MSEIPEEYRAALDRLAQFAHGVLKDIEREKAGEVGIAHEDALYQWMPQEFEALCFACAYTRPVRGVRFLDGMPVAYVPRSARNVGE
jgi:hypothetical protein